MSNDTRPVHHHRRTERAEPAPRSTEPRQLPLGPPVRIQRRRIAGWRMPDGAVYVGRPTRWGNPYPHTGTPTSRAAVVAAYRDLLARDPALTAAARRLLAGRDLACWCPPEQPCHGDVLLELANPTTPGGHGGD